MDEVHAELIEQKGSLKIFFGYAAGVGKTYGMLQAARKLRDEGHDVIVGYIEPHTRPETNALLAGLEILPPKINKYFNLTTNEFDLDAALKRQPEYICIDELAHTNPSDFLHPKRYMDVEDLLANGINVLTTVNIQHIESLNDLLFTKIGVQVKETIPNFVFDNADNIELIDIEPEQLIERLIQGKIYQEDKISQALKHFFTHKNLAVLREMSLMKTAEKLMSENVIDENGIKEKVIVCISSSPSNPKVIRAAQTLAQAFHAEFIALYIQTSQEQYKETVLANQKLAENLGAKNVTIYAESVPEQIALYAKEVHATKIVIGKTVSAEHLFSKHDTFVDIVTSRLPNTDIYVIPNEIKKPSIKKPKIAFHFKPSEFLLSILALVLATGLGLLFYLFNFGESNIIIVYILAIVFISIRVDSYLLGGICSFFSVLLFDFFFTEPRFTFVMLLTSLIIVSLTKAFKKQKNVSVVNSQRLETILYASQKIEGAETSEKAIECFLGQCALTFHMSFSYLAHGPGKKWTILSKPTDCPLPLFNEHELAIVDLAYEKQQKVGKYSDNLPSAKYSYYPITGKMGDVFGVIAFEPLRQMTNFESSLFSTILSILSAQLEKNAILAEKRRTETLFENEKTRSAFLRAVSHDLRTPLTGISGHAELLLRKHDPVEQEAIIQSIYRESKWLEELVQNILSITRLESKPEYQFEMNFISELIGEAMKHANQDIQKRSVRVEISDDFLRMFCDAKLMCQALINILNNAIEHTTPADVITLSAYSANHLITIAISNTGDNIAAEDRNHLFSMFYTTKKQSNDNPRSLGLGLYIAKSIVTAHGGTIEIGDYAPQGVIVKMNFPEHSLSVAESS
ncbi:MAG: sensor histidine kinase KdpD [Firmicutes bacterium]|nr:sensor histidine kinase KdpD [Bacillota bacterium]